MYNDVKMVGDDIVSFVKKIVSNVVENVGESVKGWMRDGDYNILEFVRWLVDSL